MTIDPLTDKLLKEFKERLANLQHIHKVLNAFFDGQTVEFSLDDTNWHEIPPSYLPGRWDWDHWHLRIAPKQPPKQPSEQIKIKTKDLRTITEWLIKGTR